VLLAVARNPEERVLLMFAFHTGARAGEQLAFEWQDLDQHNKLVVFRRSSTHGIVGPTKTGKERKVPLTATLEAALKGIKHLRGPRVFCNADGTPLTLWQLHERLWSACRRAGLRRIRWHDCRHSFASQLVMAGTPLRQVQEWLGHSSIIMTMRYSHLAPGGGREFLAALDGQQVGNGLPLVPQQLGIA
jgi:integrase